MSEYAGRIAVGAIVAVAIAVGLGFELSNFAPNVASSTTTTTLTTSQVCSGGAYGWGLIYNETNGQSYGLGRCAVNGTGPKGTAVLNVTSSPYLPIMLADGWINAFYVNLTTTQLTEIPGVSFSSNLMQAYYNEQPITNGTKLPTPYESPSFVVIPPICTWPNGQGHSFFAPLTSGPIYVKVVTDQGLVKSGTVYASHRLNSTYWRGSADYCLNLSLDTNSTGYLQVADPAVAIDGGNGLPLGGVYNYTLKAIYGANQTSTVVISDIAVQPNVVTYVTVSIPSGEVTTVTVTCTPGSACTTSTATTSAKGG